MLKYLFVMKFYDKANNGLFFLGSGLAYIATCLKQKNQNVYGLLLDLYEDEQVALSDAIIQNDIDILCIGGLSPHLKMMQHIIQIARNTKPEIKIIAGGGIISSEPEIAMKLLRADVGVIGEGEYTICEIDNTLNEQGDLCDINGIIYLNEQGQYIKTRERTDIVDINALPFPDWGLFAIDRLQPKQFEIMNALPITASRSCPYQCTFCYHPNGNKYRTRDVDNVIAEILLLIDSYGYKVFFIQDELFALNKVRLNEFCDKFSKLHKDYGAVFIAQMRADNVSRKLLRTLKESGCILMGIGMESMDDRVLASMNKKITNKQIAKAYDIAYEEGLSVTGNLIFGDIAETFETASNSIKYFLAHTHYDINILKIGTYPGSAIYEYACRNGIIKDKYKYLEEGNFYIKLTQIDDEEHKKIMQLVEYTQNNNVGRVAYMKTQNIDDSGCSNILVKCNRCMNDTLIKDVDLNHRSNRVAYCSACMKLFLLKKPADRADKFSNRDDNR